MKKTPWFDADAMPVHPGVYERDYYENGKGGTYTHFDGENWGLSFDRLEICVATLYVSEKRLPWRGLVKKA